MAPDPKPPKRIVAKGVTRKKLQRDPSCRICEYPAAGGHHLLPRRTPYRGDDVEANIVPLCGTGTTRCHGQIEDRVHEALRFLGELLQPEEYAYLVQKRGLDAAQAFLESHYYARPVALAEYEQRRTGTAIL